MAYEEQCIAGGDSKKLHENGPPSTENLHQNDGDHQPWKTMTGTVNFLSMQLFFQVPHLAQPCPTTDFLMGPVHIRHS